MSESVDTATYPSRPGEQPGLNQFERVLDTYVTPEKTFHDIRRNASWWLPFLLGICISLLFTFSVDRQIGFDKVAEANIDRSAQTQQRMNAMPEAQRARMVHTIAATTRIFSYASPVVSLIFGLVVAAILMVSFNFGLGAKETYQRYLAVWFYASLPFAIKFILAAIAIFAGASADNFDMQNPVGTNVGWYLSSESPLWLRTLLSSVDIFTIWTMVLLVIGCATVARVKRSSAAIVIVGWWTLTIVAFTAMAAMQG